MVSKRAAGTGIGAGAFANGFVLVLGVPPLAQIVSTAVGTGPLLSLNLPWPIVVVILLGSLTNLVVGLLIIGELAQRVGMLWFTVAFFAGMTSAFAPVAGSLVFLMAGGLYAGYIGPG